MIYALLLGITTSIVVGPDPGTADPTQRARSRLFQKQREVMDDAPLPWRMVETRPPDSPPILELGPFRSVQVNIDSQGNNIRGDAANEPSIVVDRTNPNRIAIGWRQFDNVQSNFRQAGRGYSRDAGRTWTFPGVLDRGVFRSDPVLRGDATGRLYYYSLTQNPFLCDTFISTDGGVGWSAPIAAFGGDKAWTALDTTTGIGRGNLYAAWDHFGCCDDNIFTRSTDRGQTYSSPVAIPGFPIWGTLDVGPDGAVYVGGMNLNNDTRFTVARSTNAQDPGATPSFDLSTSVNLGGALDGFRPGSPNPGGLLGQAWLVCDRSDGPTRGNVYLLCSVRPFAGGDPLDVMFSRSTDRGRTWSTPRRVNDDALGNWQWFGTMAVAPNGRIDVVWNDTRNSAGDYRISQLFYAYSTDAGATWSTNLAVSQPFNSTIGWPNQNKIGDYYDMQSDSVGANVAYAATFNNEQDVYYLRIGDYDCNGNGVGDSVDIQNGTSTDLNRNGIPDECEDLGDMNCDGATNNFDIDPFVLALTDPAAYKSTYPNCDLGNGDINGDGNVDNFDIDAFVELITR